MEDYIENFLPTVMFVGHPVLKGIDCYLVYKMGLNRIYLIIKKL